MRLSVTKTLAAALAASLVGTAAFAQLRLAPPTEPVAQTAEKTCDDVSLSVYFSTYEAMLSSYAMRSVNAASDQLAGCAVTEIRAVVVSEETHSDESLAQLSEARANAVLDAFASRGVRAPDTHTDIASATQGSRTSADTQTLARRVDITLTAQPGFGL